MSFIEEQKSYLEGLRGVLKKRKQAAHDDEEFQAASFLQSVVRDLLKLNDLQSSTHVLSERLNNGGTVVKAMSVIFSQSTYDSQEAEKQRIQEKLQGQAPKILASLRTLNIGPPPHSLDLLQAGAVPAELTKTDPSGFGRAAPPQQQLGSGASSTEGTPHSTSEKRYHYRPANQANKSAAKAFRAIGVEVEWDEVVAYIDRQYKGDLQFIIPDYSEPLPGQKRPTLADAIDKSKSEKKRILKIIREAKEAIKRELASPQ